MLANHERRQVIYERRAPRWVHLACLVPTIALTGIMLWAAFLKENEPDAFGRTEEIGLAGQVAFGFFVLIGLFLIGVFAYRLFRNPPYFIMYENGFEYSPGGVSTGLIKWSDVVELRDETVVQGGGGYGPERQPVTAVVLRNPGEIIGRFPDPLQSLARARLQMNSSPVLITRGEFGRDHDAMLALMREQVAKANAR